MDLTCLDLSAIDFEDQTFFLGNNSDISAIRKSISGIGILNPPTLRSVDGKYQIVTGWKRLRSCIELGHEQVTAKVYNFPELSYEDCLQVIFTDNKDRITELELAKLIILYKNLCGCDDKSLISKILPQLHIPSSRKHLDKYLSLASLHKSIKDAYYEDRITIEQCLMVSETTPGNQVPILNYLLLKYNLNNNESRQVIQLIEEITLRDLKSAEEVLEDAENEMEERKKGKNELRRELKKMRYPNLCKIEEKYKKEVDNLKLPKEVSLPINQFFEGNDLELRLKVKSEEEFSQILTVLEKCLDSGGIEKLLNIIKYGND